MPAKAGQREHGPGPGNGQSVRWLVTPKAVLLEHGSDAQRRAAFRSTAPLLGVGETADAAARSVGLSLGEILDIQPLPPDASHVPFQMPSDPFSQLRGGRSESVFQESDEMYFDSLCARKRD